MNWIQRLLARLGLPAGASLSADIATVDTVVDAIKLITDALPDAGALTTIQADLDNPNQYKANVAALALEATLTAIEGAGFATGTDSLKILSDVLDTITAAGPTLVQMQAARDAVIAAIPAMRGTDGAATVADGWDAALATILDNFTAGRITNLDELDGANIPADIDTLLTRITAAVATAAALATVDTEVGNIETKLDTPANFMADVSGIITSQGRQRDRIVKWSVGKVQVVIDAAGATTVLSTITIDTLPDGAAITSAYLMVKFRMIENKYAGVNKLNGATDPLTSQVFQIQDDGGGAWADGITFPDDYFTLADAAREGGDVLVGTLNVGVATVVDGNDIYNVRLLLGKADQDFINFDEVQAGLDILYSI